MSKRKGTSWINMYQAEGEAGLAEAERWRQYPKELKEAAVKDYLSGKGSMEGFWGILKRERYYGKRFTSREELVQMIENYITYYNNRRVQRNLGVLTPMEKHHSYPLAA